MYAFTSRRKPSKGVIDMAYISTKEAATRLGLSPVTLRVQVQKGVLDAKRLSPRRLVFDEEEIEKYDRERKGKFGSASSSRVVARNEMRDYPAIMAALLDLPEEEAANPVALDFLRAAFNKMASVPPPHEPGSSAR